MNFLKLLYTPLCVSMYILYIIYVYDYTGEVSAIAVECIYVYIIMKHAVKRQA